MNNLPQVADLETDAGESISMVMPSIHSHVNLREQIEKVEACLKDIGLGQGIPKSLWAWYGIPGIGKTTLVQRAIAGLCHRKDIPFACVDFDPRASASASEYAVEKPKILEVIVHQLLTLTPRGQPMPPPLDFEQAMAEYGQSPNGTERDERQRIVLDMFEAYVDILLQRGPIVIAFDTSEKADPEVAYWVEAQIISPLVRKGKCLVVWAGRFPWKWTRFDVRQRAISSKLGPLMPGDTAQQVGPIAPVGPTAKLDPNTVDIYRYTYGFPLGNQHLRNILKDPRAANYTERDYVDAVDEVVNTYVMAKIQPEVNLACRALAIVRQFDVEIMRRILEKFDLRPKGTPIQFIGRLTASSLVEWDDARKGFALDETIRRILAAHLRVTNAACYLELQTTAAETFAEWIQRVPENRSIYLLEHLYHVAHIGLEEDEDQSDVTGRLLQELRKYLTNYCTQENEDAVRSKMQLEQEMIKEGEHGELSEMLGNENFERLKREVAVVE